MIPTPLTAAAGFRGGALHLPNWVATYTGLSGPDWSSDGDVHVVQGEGCALLSMRIVGAESLSIQDFRRAITDAYTNLLNRLDSISARFPVRFWNFLPSIHQHMDGDQDRYMVFNSGRFAGFEARYGDRDSFDEKVATASAIGHDQSDVIIHCLATDRPGRHLGNPRQVAPYRYSQKFGPLPPCFARATLASIAGAAPVLLVGGTASIRGEESLHEGDLALQFDETVRNLTSLILSIAPAETAPLACFRELRVYHQRESDSEYLAKRIGDIFFNVSKPQILGADLCRAELLVEIEGVAEIRS